MELEPAFESKTNTSIMDSESTINPVGNNNTNITSTNEIDLKSASASVNDSNVSTIKSRVESPSDDALKNSTVEINKLEPEVIESNTPTTVESESKVEQVSVSVVNKASNIEIGIELEPEPSIESNTLITKNEVDQDKVSELNANTTNEVNQVEKEPVIQTDTPITEKEVDSVKVKNMTPTIEIENVNVTDTSIIESEAESTLSDHSMMSTSANEIEFEPTIDLNTTVPQVDVESLASDADMSIEETSNSYTAATPSSNKRRRDENGVSSIMSSKNYKKKVSTKINSEDEDMDSDSEDEDYVPEAEEDLSEEDDESTQTSNPDSLDVKVPTSDDERIRRDQLWNEFLKDVEREKNRQPAQENGTKKFTQVYDFAGERVKVIRNGDSKSNGIISSSTPSSSSTASSTSPSPIVNDSADRRTPDDGGNPTPRSRSRGISFLSGDPAKIGLSGGKRGLVGLQAVVNALKEKKQKMGTLEKSRYDWENFKEAEGIDEELQVQVRGRNGYLERQQFLQRTDLRQFEIEKNMRAKSRRNP